MAFAASASNVRQSEFTLSPGDTATFAGHTLTYLRMNTVVDDNKTKTQALVTVDGNGPFAPGISKFTFGSNVIGTPSVYSTWRTDVALSLLDVPDQPDEPPIQLRVTIQPLIMWLWIGGAIMAVGTLLAAFPGGRRRGTEPVSAPVPDRRRSDPPAGSAPAGHVAGAEADGPTGWVPVRARARAGAGGMTDLIEPTGSSGDRSGDPAGDGELDAPRRQPPGPQRRAGHRRGAHRLRRAARDPQDQRPAPTRGPHPRQAVPVVAGTTLDGGQFDIDSHRGNWVVVNFFASWCTPCKVEQPELVKFDEEHRKAGDVKVVSVVFQPDDEADVRDFFDQSGATWPVIGGDTGSIALNFGVTAVPETYLVSPDGQVVAKFENVTATELDSVIARYAGAAAANTPSTTP